MNDDTPAWYAGGNRLIDSLPQAERIAVTDNLTVVPADETSGGISRGQPIAAVYFPVDAVFSVLAELEGGHCYEVDSVGREGLIGGELAFGVRVALRSVICQIGGTAAQMPLDAFERCLAELPSFGDAVRKALLLQWYRAQQTVACNFAHSLVQRCARWTMLTRDALGCDTFALRAEYLSMMLGAGESVVAEPMASLERLGALRYAEDVVTVISVPRLRDAACECYGDPLHVGRQPVSRATTGRREPQTSKKGRKGPFTASRRAAPR